MGGVVAGSVMKEISFSSKKWGAVMINTACNQNCPECYLGEKEGNVAMSTETAEKIIVYAKKNMDGIAIVGTEPLLEGDSVSVVNLFASSLPTHIITNGRNLGVFVEDLSLVKRIDISLRGGLKTYNREGDIGEIISSAKQWKSRTGGEIYILNMITSENCTMGNISDMLAVGPEISADGIIFSPVVQTIGGRKIKPVFLKKISEELSNFTERNDRILSVDPYHAYFERGSWDEMKKGLKSVLPEKNLLIIDFDPGDRIDRVDVHGKAHHPFIALHPGVKLPGKELY